jgi:hypothetical protein
VIARPLRELAEAAYLFGYPLVSHLTEVRAQTTEQLVPFVGPVNLFGQGTALPGPTDHFVILNNDTLYAVAHCDVSAEPLVLHVPDTDDRYYVVQCIDPWTNAFAYIGRRATGTKEGAFLFAPADWIGHVPDGVTRITTPNTLFTIKARYAASGPDDLVAVDRLQEQTWVTPLSRYPEPPQTAWRTFGDRNIAPFNEGVAEELRFWEQLRAWMAQFPPPDADRALVWSFVPLGLLGRPDTYLHADADLVAILTETAQTGQARVEALATEGIVVSVNGWLQAPHSFDYNTDRLELGTIDSPAWKICNRDRAHKVRAGSARSGLWDNHGYEADCAFAFVDEQDAPLCGAHRYVIHFARTPPVDAFWSLAMYDAANFCLVENPINRYSIGDRTPGVRYNADGSLDLYLQYASPGAEQEANWLPTPAGAFLPILRMYQPHAAVLDGRYVLPPITRR